MIFCTVDGSWFCNNAGTVTPVEGARVEFWQQESSVVDWFDVLLSSTHTDGQGQYSGRFQSHHSHGFYARLVLNDDQGAHLHPWYSQGSWCYDAPPGDNRSGRIHNDLLIVQDNGAGTPRCAVWQGARVAVQEYAASVGGAPPAGDYDIALETTIFPTPWSTISTTHWPHGYSTVGGGPNSLYAVNIHEFAHTVRQSLDGNFFHFLFDAARFDYARTHSPTDCGGTNAGFAFNEGWAEFWATDWGAAPPSAPCRNTEDIEQEGDVAAMLYALSQCPDVGRAGMVRILRDNPGSIHSFPDFQASLRGEFPNCDVGALRQGETVRHNAGEEAALTVPQRVHTIEQYLAAQTQVSAKLDRMYADAVAAAAGPHSCDTEEACEELFQSVSAPSLISGRIEQSKHLVELFDAELKFLREHPGGVDDPRVTASVYEDRVAQQKKFDDLTYEIVTGAADRALAAVDPFAAKDSKGVLGQHVSRIREVVVELENRRAKDLEPPPGLQPAGMALGEAMTRR